MFRLFNNKSEKSEAMTSATPRISERRIESRKQYHNRINYDRAAFHIKQCLRAIKAGQLMPVEKGISRHLPHDFKKVKEYYLDQIGIDPFIIQVDNYTLVFDCGNYTPETDSFGQEPMIVTNRNPQAPLTTRRFSPAHMLYTMVRTGTIKPVEDPRQFKGNEAFKIVYLNGNPYCFKTEIVSF